MDPVILRKPPEEYDIKLAISKVLNIDVTIISKIEEGEVNHVYKVQTNAGNFVARIFRHSHWPEPGKLEWIEKQLTLHKIPHPKTIFYSRSQEHFSNGFMISEFAEGQSGKEAITSGLVSFEMFHQKLAVLLYQVHSIPVSKFGLVNNGEGQNNSLRELKVTKVKKIIDQLNSASKEAASQIESIQDIVDSGLSRYEGKLKPVLIHGDPTVDNIIYTPQGELMLVDWDGALADSWLRDYSWITYFGSGLSQGSLEERQVIIRNAFAEFHPQTDLDQDEIGKIESIYHILQAIDLLPYYYFDQQNMGAFNKTLDRLDKLSAHLSK